ncbi:MAG: hypothetical protein GWO87_02340, partial [Xanthomonadaceae bacterium]|nr:hypothetical protein [Rhodospirillaceae bacterium]NIA18006.1 hypothetical protein [Xanthomonadaceae bacterium]
MSVEKSQQTKNSVEQKNISVNKEKKSFWEKSQKLLSNKEIYKQLFKTGVGTFASIKGVKSFYDVPAYFKQKFEAHENKKEFKEIMSELNKEGIDKENIKDKKVGEIIDFKVMDEMQNKIEGLDVNEEIKNKLTEELNIMIENYRDEMEDLEAQENETLEEVLDEYIRTKITGVQVSKEVLNTFFVGSAVANPTLAPAAYLSRSLSYGFMDGVNRYLRLRKNAERKDKNTSIKEEDVGIIKDVIINGIKETFQDAILKSNSRIEKTGKQKAMDFIKAWGKIVKYTFIGAKVEFNSESLSKSFERSLDAFEGRNNLSLSEMGSNVTKNIEGIPSRYWNIIKKPFNWFHSDIEKSGEIGGKEEPEAANATNVTKFAAEDSSNETEIKHPKITELIPKNATENSVTTSGISLEDKNLWQELADKDQTLADKWKKFLNEHPKYLLTYKKVLDDGLNSGEEEDFTKMLKEMKSTGMS